MHLFLMHLALHTWPVTFRFTTHLICFAFSPDNHKLYRIPDVASFQAHVCISTKSVPFLIISLIHPLNELRTYDSASLCIFALLAFSFCGMMILWNGALGNSLSVWEKTTLGASINKINSRIEQVALIWYTSNQYVFCFSVFSYSSTGLRRGVSSSTSG